jgi:restriction system protein
LIENNPSNVASAFEILLEEIEAEVDLVNGIGSRAFEDRNYDKAREALERVGAVTAFRDKVAALRREWQELASSADNEDDEETLAARSNLGRLHKGQRTPEQEYQTPILRVLSDMGGSGKVSDVLNAVFEIVTPILRDVDLDPLASDPANPRWRNAAQWARNTMVQEGLLSRHSPRGIWEITDSGRATLNNAGDSQ